MEEEKDEMQEKKEDEEVEKREEKEKMAEANPKDVGKITRQRLPRKICNVLARWVA